MILIITCYNNGISIKQRTPSLNRDEGLYLAVIPVIYNSLLGLRENEVTRSLLIIHIADEVRVVRTKYSNVKIFCSEFWNSVNVNVFTRA